MARKKSKRLPSEIMAASNLSVEDQLTGLSILLVLRAIGFDLDFEKFVELADKATNAEDKPEDPAEVLDEFASAAGWQDADQLAIMLAYADDPAGMTMREFLEAIVAQSDEPVEDAAADEADTEADTEPAAESADDQQSQGDHPLIGKAVTYRPDDATEIDAVVISVADGRAMLVDSDDNELTDIDVELLEPFEEADIETFDTEEEGKPADFSATLEIHPKQLDKAKKWLDGKKPVKGVPLDEPLAEYEVGFGDSDILCRLSIVNHGDGPYIDAFLYDASATLAEHPPAYELERSFRIEHEGQVYEVVVTPAG